MHGCAFSVIFSVEIAAGRPEIEQMIRSSARVATRLNCLQRALFSSKQTTDFGFKDGVRRASVLDFGRWGFV